MVDNGYLANDCIVTSKLIDLTPRDKLGNELVKYRAENGEFSMDVGVDYDNETVWMTQRQIAELFDVSRENITIHIGNIFEDGELEESSTCKDYLEVRHEGDREVKRKIMYYNLDVILSVGYRVKSIRGTQFRQWATKVLMNHIKGKSKKKKSGYVRTSRTASQIATEFAKYCINDEYGVLYVKFDGVWVCDEIILLGTLRKVAPELSEKKEIEVLKRVCQMKKFERMEMSALQQKVMGE